ncbi:hypothetical protein [Actinoplanes siamensis]|uniref:Uncharacterized protein n=1 Tax=Actinoplanes siamensis TaxID=1223317 RepID=A0A919N5H5_9ACTN|nr:hypothetical protein [Actinoplanes siamensis]GIF04677.1 hypothetical protein Asi03nite_22150 [Actinoplanes siamensis]
MSKSVRSAVPAGADAPRLVLGEQPFDVAATALRLLTTGPEPLSVDGAALGGGLPRRRIVLSELASILMHPSCGHTTSDQVWRLLIEGARTDGSAWVVGAVGVALPGLRQAAYRLRHYSGDVQAELLTGFVAALRTVSPSGARVVQRLLSAAITTARAELRASEPRRETDHLDTMALWPGAGHPDVVLARAVTAGVITAADAELIGATRLAGTSVAEYAESLSKGAKAIYKARDRAEGLLVAALRAGLLSDPDAEVIAEATMTLRADF